MGTFQVTYDDFSGGHYMGDRSTELPKNTWKGDNVILSVRGDLVPTGVKEMKEFAAPTPASGTWNYAQVKSAFAFNVIYGVAFVSYYGTAVSGTVIQIVDTSTSGTPTTFSYTITGRVDGTVTFDNVRTGSSTDKFFTYINAVNGDVRQWSWVTATDSLVVANPFSTNNPVNLVQVGARLVTWFNQSLYYSGASDAATWSTATQYYDFPDVITGVFPRSNDFIVTTVGAVYSVTGVLGESINIQPIIPNDNARGGFRKAVIDNRVVYLLDEGTSAPGLPDGVIYALNGADIQQAAYLDQNDLLQGLQYRNSAESFVLGMGQNNNLICWSRQGTAWARAANNTWSRFTYTAKEMDATKFLQAAVCVPIAYKDTVPQNEYFTVVYTGSDEKVYFVRYIHNHGFPNSDDFDFDDTVASTTPASGTVDLSEYWHSKPCVVKEIMVEAVFDTSASLDLTGNATIEPFVKPTGIVDIGPNDTNSFVSSTQTITQAISSISADNSVALYRFKVNNAGRSYGFYPRLTFQGCRIRRVICVCED